MKPIKVILIVIVVVLASASVVLVLWALANLEWSLTQWSQTAAVVTAGNGIGAIAWRALYWRTDMNRQFKNEEGTDYGHGGDTIHAGDEGKQINVGGEFHAGDETHIGVVIGHLVINDLKAKNPLMLNTVIAGLRKILDKPSKTEGKGPTSADEAERIVQQMRGDPELKRTLDAFQAESEKTLERIFKRVTPDFSLEAIVMPPYGSHTWEVSLRKGEVLEFRPRDSSGPFSMTVRPKGGASIPSLAMNDEGRVPSRLRAEETRDYLFEFQSRQWAEGTLNLEYRLLEFEGQ